MKRKNIFATFLISTATVCMVLGYHVLNKNDLLNILKAEDEIFEMSIGGSKFAPQPDDEHSGVLTDGYNEFFYLSHGQALVLEQQAIYLQAKDNKTPAVFCNKTVINGITSVKATFSGGPLYAIVTSTFFERYEYQESDRLTTDVEKTFSGSDLGYLLIICPSTEVTELSNVTAKYRCNHDTDKGFFYAPGLNDYSGTRSWGVNRKMRHDYVEFTTDPQPYNNNYSDGKTPPHVNNDSWYRWNGVSLHNYELIEEEVVYDDVPYGNFVSDKFEIITSVMVEPRVFYDENAWFCAAPWVSLRDENHAGDEMFLYAYLGNDNYDPLGDGGVAGRLDTYEGRFYTKYGAGGGGYDWGFFDPDVETVVDSTMTLREAYEATNLPFFNIRFVIDGNTCAVYINDFKVYYNATEFYETYTDQKYTMHRFELHGVNYGLKDGTAGDASSVYDPYRLTYLNPIVREIV